MERLDCMADVRFIIWEQTSRWAAAFRSVLQGNGLRVRETHDWKSCWSELQKAAASLLALEIRPDNFVEAVDQVMMLRRDYPRVGLLVLTTPELARHQWLLREAGVLTVVVSTHNLAPTARLVQRFLSQAKQPSQGWHQSLMARLPWTDI
jgi:hypothetical protein